MASYTSRFNLKKPSQNENVSLADINGNMDSIDTKAVLRTGDTMSGDLTLNSGVINAAFGFVPTDVCDIGIDLNNATSPGVYKYSTSCNNKPTAYAGTLLVMKYSSSWITQLAFPAQNSYILYARVYGSGSWGDWHLISNYKASNIVSETVSVSTTNAWVNTGVTVSVTAGHIYAIGVSIGSGGRVYGIQLRTAANRCDYEHSNETDGSIGNLMPIFYCKTSGSYNIWVKRLGTGEASYSVTDIGQVKV